MSENTKFMKLSEITEDKDDDDVNSFVDAETQRERIRKIIEYQKSLDSSLASSSSSSYSKPSSASCCSLRSSVRKSKSLFDLMRSGSTSLRRLFDMEHTSLATYFEDYSGSPVIKPIFLWESDAENEMRDPWEAVITHFRLATDAGTHEADRFSSKFSFVDEDLSSRKRKLRIGNYKLTRKKSFRKLPRFGLWICKGFRFGLRLRKKLRIVTCKRK